VIVVAWIEGRDPPPGLVLLAAPTTAIWFRRATKYPT
jgi:hypothetical protein